MSLSRSSISLLVLLLLYPSSCRVSSDLYSRCSSSVQYLIEYALSFVGTPYRWGGESPMDGFDCSGFVQEILRSAGVDPIGDQTSQGLFEYFAKHGKPLSKDRPRPGSIVFYGSHINHITHVAFALDHFRVVEAAGGDHTTTSVDRAIAQQAFIRIRPLKHRGDLIAVLHPDYSQIGISF